MRNYRRGKIILATGLGLATSLLSGCQTWMGGMTLPSGHYLEHVPQYFPQEPDFPLQRELAYQEETAALTAPVGRLPFGAGPGPVPGGPPPLAPVGQGGPVAPGAMPVIPPR